jgi:hypothetical protein
MYGITLKPLVMMNLAGYLVNFVILMIALKFITLNLEVVSEALKRKNRTR